MHLYRGTAASLASDLASGQFTSQLEKRFLSVFGYRASPSEARSWAESLPAVARVVVEAGLADVEVLVEYQLPLTSKRIDVLLVGSHPDGGVSAVVVELKQWTMGEIEDVDERTVVVLGRRLLHPQQQVAQYVEYLADFNQLGDQGVLTVSGFAFLHNATRTQTAGLRSAALANVASFPIFSGEETGQLRAFLTKTVSSSGAATAADDFLLAPTRPSKKLLDHVQRQIQGQPAFTLLDEQLVAYDVVRRAVDESKRANHKTVVMITGGPGTGKSVIATTLLADLARRGHNISHATGSKSFTTTLRQQVGRKAGNLFRYFNNFGDLEPNELDVLIADEAHRIRASSNDRFTPRAKRSSLPQVDELIQVARVPVFLLDERQVVRPGEIGTVAAIREAAARNGVELIEVDLNGQFRCAGSAAYIEWVEALLGLGEGSPGPWPREEVFELAMATSPEELEAWVRSRAQKGHTARLSAGFCWPWSDPRADGTLVDDVVVDGWKRPWNAKPGKKVVGAPPASLWATDPAGVDQVGCIYTAQGFEYDYAGVIMGPDLTWRDDGWVGDKTRSHDPIVRTAENFVGASDLSGV